ncbi:MAG: radical SAM family heme chaperone HemW [Verrucomicrobia bacterium]|nr:radical SAM family heme chaperone HemW [Verrucomicrobiota bacterium]MDE3100399.1 radical SAM family heme chaperone HemW [Verrucomicrobiota bacterium]
MPEQTATAASLYVHVPFCAHKCEYCAFYSEVPNGDLMNRYVDALVREMGMVAGDLRPRTIFFGGGTPSLLNLRQWEEVFRAMEALGLPGAEEFTVECNPATVSADKAKLLRDHGVNRISMGVQSLDESLLERLGRVHSREMVFKSFDILRRAGFDNVNLDLMFAIPGQSMAAWRSTLDEVTAMQSEHLSCYEVIYEEDTPLFHQLQAGRFSVDEDLACDMHDELAARAAEAGFHQYEIANFARHSGGRMADAPSMACRHNVNYWRGGSFYGLGPGATSYIRALRTKNWPNTQLYCAEIESGKRAIESSEELPPLRRAGETAAFGLRMNAGWPFEEFRRVTDFDLREGWRREMDDLAGRGWGRRDATRFQLTPLGMRFADAAAEEFLR